MPCYYPITAFRSKERNKNGKRNLVFKEEDALNSEILMISCGKCIGCRLERSRQWAMRCMHESQLHDQNCYITLTYDNDNLPKDGSLQLRDWQLFMKKLRKKYGNGIRFFHCGEYGDINLRPHYHACIFGFDFPDRQFFKEVNGYPLYVSAELSKLWPKGFSTIGNVTFESAAYVARYILKKINGKEANEHYLSRIDEDTGECFFRRPEYVTMSRRPGIGAGWLDKYKDDVYPCDFVVCRGMKMKPPKYYDYRIEQEDSDFVEMLKARRVQDSAKNADNNTLERLAVREKVQLSKMNLLPRNL